MCAVIVGIIGFVLIAKGENEMINVGEKMVNVEGLLVPTPEEARYMIDQFPDWEKEGGPVRPVFPLSYSIYLAQEHGLATETEFSREYLNMQALYRKALEQYLQEISELSSFDERLANSPLDFRPLPEERMCFYQQYSTFDFQFIFLRNNLPIERLSSEDIELLRGYIRNGSSEVTEAMLELVARTFQSIIVAHEDRDYNIDVGYHPGGEFAANNALVLQITHARHEGGRYRREYLEQEIVSLMERVLSEQIGVPVVVFTW